MSSLSRAAGTADQVPNIVGEFFIPSDLDSAESHASTPPKVSTSISSKAPFEADGSADLVLNAANRVIFEPSYGTKEPSPAFLYVARRLPELPNLEELVVSPSTEPLAPRKHAPKDGLAVSFEKDEQEALSEIALSPTFEVVNPEDLDFEDPLSPRHSFNLGSVVQTARLTDAAAEAVLFSPRPKHKSRSSQIPSMAVDASAQTESPYLNLSYKNRWQTKIHPEGTIRQSTLQRLSPVHLPQPLKQSPSVISIQGKRSGLGLAQSSPSTSRIVYVYPPTSPGGSGSIVPRTPSTSSVARSEQQKVEESLEEKSNCWKAFCGRWCR